METNKIYNIDCMEFMKQMSDKSVDLVLTDPPYGMTSCEWDKFKIEWFDKLFQIAKTLIFTASQPFTSILINRYIKFFDVEWIWQKSCGSNFLNAKSKPFKEHENIIVFKTDKLKYNPIMQERFGSGKQKIKSRCKPSISGEVFGSLITNIKYKAYPEKRYPSSVQFFNNRDTERGLHPTQKPIELMKYFVKTYSDEGDVVLDPFAGSGTTLVACKLLNRKYIGCEKEPKYVEICKQRLAQGVIWEEIVK